MQKKLILTCIHLKETKGGCPYFNFFVRDLTHAMSFGKCSLFCAIGKVSHSLQLVFCFRASAERCY